MWFKNLKLFHIQQDIEYQPEELAAKFEQIEFKPCTPAMPVSVGWVPPIDKDGAPLVHAANGFMLLCLRVEEKILPSTVVREKVAERVKQIEREQERKVYNKEKRGLQDEIYFSLLPQAFTKSSRIYGYIDTRSNWLVLDTSSESKSELFITFVRKALDTFKVTTPQTDRIPTLMTDWVSNNRQPQVFDIEESCMLLNPNQQRRTVRCQNQDVTSDGVQYFLDQGSEVWQLALSWREQIAFTLKDDATVVKVKFLDGVVSQAKDLEGSDVEEQFDADFYIMVETVAKFLVDYAKEVGVKEPNFDAQEKVKSESGVETEAEELAEA